MTDSPADDEKSIKVKPLTRRVEHSGKLYERRPEVERQLADAIRLPAEDILERVKDGDRDSPLFLKEEALVYLIREYYGRSQEDVFEALYVTLTNRCLAHIKRTVLKVIDRSNLDDCAHDTLARAFSRILDLDSDRGDFAQVSFWSFVTDIANDLISNYARHQRQDRVTDSYDAAPSEGSNLADLPEGGGAVEDRLVERITQRERRGKIQGALVHLPEHVRKAIILYHFYEWQIESKDPQVMTIARHFEKTPRTIRNWLAEGEKQLGQHLGGTL